MYTVEKVFSFTDGVNGNTVALRKKEDYYLISVNKANGSSFEFYLHEIAMSDMFKAIKEMTNFV